MRVNVWSATPGFRSTRALVVFIYALAPSSHPRLPHNSSQSIRTHPRSDTPHILMMPGIEHRLEILRLQIPNQSNPPMPKRNTLIEQRDGGIGVSSRIRALDQFGRLRTRHINRSAQNRSRSRSRSRSRMRFKIAPRPVQLNPNPLRALTNLGLMQSQRNSLKRRPLHKRKQSNLNSKRLQHPRMRLRRKKLTHAIAIPLIVDHRVRALLRRLAAIRKTRINHDRLCRKMLMRMNTNSRRHDKLIDKHTPALASSRATRIRSSTHISRQRLLERLHDSSGSAASSMIRTK